MSCSGGWIGLKLGDSWSPMKGARRWRPQAQAREGDTAQRSEGSP